MRFCPKMALLIACLISSPSAAQLSVIAGPVEADVKAVTDGDTFTFIAFPFPELSIRGRLRVDGVDTPEIRGKCADEKNRAQQAKRFVEDLVSKAGGRVWLYTIGLEGDDGGGFGRYRAQVRIGNQWLSAELIREGLARENHGESRKSWC